MDVFRTDRIRNVVLLGHGGAGKTTLAEAMAYLAGMTNRLGRVEDGNTVSDYDKEEIKRHFSISTTLIPVPWDKVKINVLDTPGYFDFVGEVEEAVSAADAAIIVVSGKAGVQVGTQKAWNLCEKYKLPRMIFVTDMDVDDVSYRKVVEQLTELYGKKIAPLHFPIREDGKFVGYVNVVKQAGRKYIDKGKKEECPIPEYLDEYLEKYHDILMESVAETSEEFMDRYFEGDTFSVTEVSAALAMNVQEASIVPVCMGSPINLRGVSNLLDDICGYFPSPDKRSCNGIAQKTNEIFEANYDFTKVKSAYVWKTIADPFLGKYSLIKVCSGVIKSDDTLLNVEKGEEERLNKLYVLEGSKPIEVPELHAGDIGAIAKLNSVQTGDSLATKANPILYPKALLSTPYTCKRFKAVKKGDEDKISQALAKMMSEDKTLRVVNDSANRQSLIYGIGDQHLDIVMNKLKERYKVDVELSKPKVPFRETIRKNADVEGKHKKQSGGHGQYGHVKMRFEPSGDLETPYEFEQPIAGVQTITVPEVVLKQGSRYSVVITNSGIEKISFGVEAKSSYGNWFTCTAGIETGQTFYKSASETARWTDGKTKNWTARIKAHTRTLNQSWVPDTPVFQVKAYNSGYNLISWKKVSGATGYYVYRKPAAGGKWSKIADVGTSELKYKDSKVTANASYRYTVKAYYEASGKRYSGKYKTGDVIKAAPAVQKVTSVKSEKNGIRIRWKPQKKCDGYYIYRKKKGGSYQLIKKISNGNSSSYLDKKAQKGVSYYYAVKAYVKEPYGNTYSKYKSSSAVKRK